MPHFKKLTPNLVVADVSRSLAFYVDVLGFTRAMTVPDEAPFVFASVSAGPIEIFFNDRAAAVAEYPVFADRPIGASATLFVEVEGIDALHARLDGAVAIVMPLVTQWYGLREFAIADPDGYLITFAERVQRA
jgi:uncharacterized glyoxalase superfamily protein PhnB